MASSYYPEKPKEEFDPNDGFQPIIDQQTTKQLVNYYKYYPQEFDEDKLQQVELHAQHYRIPFARNDKDNKVTVAGLVKQAGAGFGEGFSTFKMGEDPKNEWEAIARNVGHLAGFVGFLPVPAGAIGKAGYLANAARALKGKSIPMIGANFLTKKAADIARNAKVSAAGLRGKATHESMEWLGKHTPVAEDLIEGAFHLGTASAISAWQGGVDEMMEAFIGGAQTGAVFRGIGNFIKTGNPEGDAMLRMVSASAFSGLPSTIAGQTTPEQIYHYLLGAYFGYKEAPYTTRESRKFIAERFKDGTISEPMEAHPEFSRLSKPSQDATVKLAEQIRGKVDSLGRPVTANIIVSELLKDMPGMSLKEREAMANKLLEQGVTVNEYGEIVKTVKAPDPLQANKIRTEEITDTDIGTVDIKVPLKIDSYVTRNMEKYWEASETPNKTRVESIVDINNKWQETLKKAQEGTEAFPEKAMMDYLQKKYGQAPEDANQRWWRQYATTSLRDKVVDQLTSKPFVKKGEKFYKQMPEGQFNDAGNLKLLKEEPKLIDRVYNQAYRKMTGQEPSSKAYSVLDHFTAMEGGTMKEMGLLSLPEFYARAEFPKVLNQLKEMGVQGSYQMARQMSIERGKKLTDKFHAQNFYNLHKEADMYYYGGKGDAERMYFMKYHPATPKVPSRLEVNSIRDGYALETFRQQTGTSKKSMQAIKNAFTKEYNRERQEYIDTYAKLMKDGKQSNKEVAGRMFDKAYLSNAIYELELNGFASELTPSNIAKLFGKGMINSSKAYNKRAQIWFTTGHSGDARMIEAGVKDLDTGRFKYRLIKDESLAVKEFNQETPASKMVQGTDGAIYGRSDVIAAQNKDWGMNNEGSGHKSFIVSNSQKGLGAFLGKYAVFQASPELEAYMQKNNLHFIVPETAAKQYGNRIFGELIRGKKGIEIKGGEDYFLLPSEMKGIYSERFDNHSLDMQRLPKQMLSNLTPYSWSKINPETIDNMFGDLSRRSFEGNAEINAKIKMLMRDPSNEAYQNDIIRNLDNAGVKELLVAMKTPGLEKFATRVYRKIQRMDLFSDAEMALQEGELTKEQFERLKGNSYELNIVHEKIQELAGESLAGMMHKYVIPYRQTVIRNWVTNQLVRPKVENSFAARMRPYEIGLRNQRVKGQNTSLLEKRDDIFFLDNNYRDMMINSEAFTKPKTLGEIWDAYNAGQYKGKVKRQVEEALTAVVQRTPMDSMSGAHKLKFGGFTGVKGIGVLLHPRTMEALGGADLDGDKAFGFFGGMSKDGTRGGGFKQAWMDMYGSQKQEFWKKDGTISHNKNEIDPITGKQYRDILAITEPEVLDKINSSVLKLSPLRRMKASMGAAEGRGLLGPAVVNKAVLSSAYAAIRGSEEGRYLYSPTTGIFKNYNIVITPKTDAKSMESFRGLTRASIALGSDPMDEAGLRSRQLFFMEAAKRAFNFEVKFKNGQVHKKLTAKLQKNEAAMRAGLIKTLGRINSVLFGRNLIEGRRWFPEEIAEAVNSATETLAPMASNTLFPKLAETMRGVDLSDNVLRRIKYEEYQNLYAEHNKRADALGDLKSLLGRGSFKTPMNQYLKDIFANRLYTEEGFRQQLDPSSSMFKEKMFSRKEYEHLVKRRDLDVENNMAHREELMRDILAKGERYVTEDLGDFTSLKLISEAAEGVSPARIKKIWKEADLIKKSNYLANKRRNSTMEGLSTLSEAEANFVKQMELQIAPERQSAVMTKAQTDQRIELFKRSENLNEQEVKLFENILMGTYSRGTLNELESRIQAYTSKKWSPEFREEINNLREMASNTSMTKLGIESDAISKQTKKKYFDEYVKNFDRSIDVVSEAEKARLKKEVMEDKPIELFKDGEKVKGQSIEASDYDAKTRKYIDEVAPFEGIKEGKLEKKEHKQLLADLKEKLDIAFPNIVGRDLNGLMRERFNKDINKVDLADLKAFNNWLGSTLDGSWYQRTFSKIKKGLPALSKWHYSMFPEAINQDLMRKEILLLERRGLFKDAHGNIISGRVMKPTGIMEVIQDYIHKGQEWSIAASEKEKGRFREELAPYMNLKEGYDLHEIAIALRERKVPERWRERYESTDNGMYLWIKEAYEKAYREIPKKHDWKTLKEKSFIVTKKDKVESLTGDQIVKEINDIYTKKNEEAHSWLTGKEEALNAYKALRVDSNNKRRSDYEYFRQIKKKFYRDMVKASEKGEMFDIGLGIDGLRWVARRVMISQIPKQYNKERSALLKNLGSEVEKTGQYDFDMYFPHLNFNRKEASKQMERGMDFILNNSNLSKKEKEKELKKLVIHHKQLTGDYMSMDKYGEHFNEMQKVMEDIALRKKVNEDRITWFKNNKMGNQFSRSAHIDGWERTPEAYETYIKNIMDTYYRLASQVVTKNEIVNWSYQNYLKAGGKKGAGKEDLNLINSWRSFFNLYAQGAMGYSTKIPEALMKNPDMKLKGSMYAWTADSEVTKRINKIANKLGVQKTEAQKMFPEMGGPYDLTTIARFSNMEAKYALASLLAHPKSAVANLYGGSVQTLISSGWDNFKKARDMDYLRSNINPEWKNIKDVEAFVKKQGVIEEFLMYEATLNPEIKGEKWSKFMKDAVGKIKQDPTVKDATLMELAKKRGITEQVFNKAGWFMREPERILRRDAFMAHLIQAREKFGGAIKQYDHPILIEMAKKGVKATQFLYSAPFRPMFAATNFGKMMTRFQLWSWNAVRFRKDILKEANMRGFQEGTMEYERFKRLATADLFMLAMSNVFMYSLFESTLPAPWSYFQDTADWLLGDEKERDRAFFGQYPTAIAPLQLITPPSLRLLPSLFKGLVEDDYSKMSDYVIWTMFPFGRIGRDIAGPNGLLENPYMAVEKMTGLPYMQFGREMLKYRDSEVLSPGEGLMENIFEGDEDG